MKVAVYTLTRDRVEYTRHCFATLYEKAGHPFDHYILDNGSSDDTPQYLEDLIIKNPDRNITYYPSKINLGISAGSNKCLELIADHNYDLIIKMDNDCEVVSDDIIKRIVAIYENIGKYSSRFILSPKVNGINRQPTRGAYTTLSNYRIGLTAIVGGLFHVVPASVYRVYRYPTNLKPGHGQDDHICHWFKQQGGQVGYIEGLEVNHYETTDCQAKRYPDYFKRKWEENK